MSDNYKWPMQFFGVALQHTEVKQNDTNKNPRTTFSCIEPHSIGWRVSFFFYLIARRKRNIHPRSVLLPCPIVNMSILTWINLPFLNVNFPVVQKKNALKGKWRVKFSKSCLIFQRKCEDKNWFLKNLIAKNDLSPYIPVVNEKSLVFEFFALPAAAFVWRFWKHLKNRHWIILWITLMMLWTNKTWWV